ncbi:uncharacterized protein LOC134236792, partial [Saccostrea cucullata]|uniref:uncharacterized protein LOC134236792 n=1 Tax=Saccostrea cuccullata TaxID=36930 RepID=UPI002ECFFC4F
MEHTYQIVLVSILWQFMVSEGVLKCPESTEDWGMCPEFNFKARRIDVYQCKSNENNCPTTTYWSNAVYVYPGCFHNVSSNVLKSSTTLFTLPLTIEITTKDSASANDTSSSEKTSNAIPFTSIIIIIISSLIVTIVLFLGIGCLVFRWRHRRELSTGEKDKDNNSPEEEIMLRGT